jgi:hypothetical protein
MTSRLPMTEVVRIPAGTKLARNPDGTYFPVDDDDPRRAYELVNTHVTVDGRQYVNGEPLTCVVPTNPFATLEGLMLSRPPKG